MEIDERNTKTLTLRDGPLEKLWGGVGEGNFRAAEIFFSLSNSFYEFFSAIA